MRPGGCGLARSIACKQSRIAMSEPGDESPRADDFAAGWLLAWKALLAAGVPAPDLSRVEMPEGIGSRLTRDAECLRGLLEVWPARPAPPGVAAAAEPDGDPNTRIGRFRLRRELGRGGYGIVYLANDPFLDREVAVKIPRPGADFDPEAGHRLAVEAQAAARMAHPNIVPLLECGTAGAVPYVVSAYCPGISLADWLGRTATPVPWRDAAGLVAAVARGVQHAHARGVLHRDLKPANILLSPGEGDPGSGRPDPPVLPTLNGYRPLISDFGLAKLLVESHGPQTTTGVIRGTPAYMAPEQASGRPEDVTTAVDVHALGAILYELLVRHPPFAGDTPLATLARVRSEIPRPPRALRSGLPADLETICLKCLRKDPARRYASAGELADDLDRLLRGEAVLARPTGPLEKLARTVRRYPAVAGLSAVLAIALVGGLVVATALWQRTRAERDRAKGNLADLLWVSEETAVSTANDPALQADEARALRERLLAESARRFEWLASRLAAEPADRPLLARCNYQLGMLSLRLGRMDEARGAAAQAEAAYESLLRESPADPQVAFGLTLARMTSALVQNHGHSDPPSVERARQAFAAYLAIPDTGTDPALRRRIAFATFLYDLAVGADKRLDRKTALQYVADACDRLRPLARAGSPVRQPALDALVHFLAFQCQLERFGQHPEAAVATGEEAYACAKTIVREWPKNHQGWRQFAVSCNEYGSALRESNRPRRAVEVWREGFDLLSDSDACSSTEGLASLMTRHDYNRLMIAYNLALECGGLRAVPEYEHWLGISVDLGRRLLFTLGKDKQVRYMYGISCANLTDLRRRKVQPVNLLPLHCDGLESLETALRIAPDDARLRNELGQCWGRYAQDLERANQYGGALVARVMAMTHELAASLALPADPARRDRLVRDFRKSAELTIRILTAVPVRF
jgi:hypothetical protein